jgi:bacillithiol biosynthesis cysteine-adding enzyme BshC
MTPGSYPLATGDTIRAVQTHVPITTFPGAGGFLGVYATDFQQVASWFHYNPHSDDSLRQRIDDLATGKATGTVPTERAEAAAAVYAQQARWGAGEAALSAAQQLASPDTFAVVTGQQVGVFGGPLYTVFKAISAIQWARYLKQQFPQHRFVPTFWMATSDSDFGEVRQTWVLTGTGELAELALAEEAIREHGLIVSRRNVRLELDALLQRTCDAISPGQHRDEVLRALSQDYGEGGMVEGFARWMARLFQETELVLIDPQDPALIQVAQPLIEHELQTAATSEAIWLERSQEIVAAGFTPQVEHLPGDTGLFLLDETGRREKIAREDDGFILRQSNRQLSPNELLDLAREAPERFVLGVELRPVYQNMLFPAAVFIGGGAEIAYRAQVTALFEHHGQLMAPAFPRASATLLTRKQAELLDRLGIALPQCHAVPQDVAALAVSHSRAPEIEQALARYLKLITGADHDIERLAVEIDPALGQAFGTLRGNLGKHVEKLEKKITSALKRQNEELLARVARTHTAVFPRLAPQERILPLLSFLPRYGFGLVGTLTGQLDHLCWEHQVIILD